MVSLRNSALAAVTTVGLAAATCIEVSGNWYCNEVASVQFDNFGTSGTYELVTAMDETSCSCSQSSQSFSGVNAPFNEELSIHFRGPLQLKQFAWYLPSSSSSKRSKIEPREPHERRHGGERGHEHLHDKRRNQRASSSSKTTSSTTTLQTSTTSSLTSHTSTISSSSSTTSKTTTGSSSSSTKATSSAVTSSKTSSSTIKSTTTSTTTAAAASGTGSWVQQGYYSSTAGTSSGLTFLNLCGGEVSGIWSSCFGSSLSYATADGTNAASSSTILEDTTLPSSAEVVLMTDKSCSDGLCGYYRPGSVAYHGFSGTNKLFLIEFGMPAVTSGGNAPAIWLLNALIPRTQEYGSCSCWGNTAGCGELDVFEVLDAGDTRAVSSIHGVQAGGDADYFVRPESGTQKAAIMINNGVATIWYLASSVTFGSTMSTATLQEDIASGNTSTVTLT